MKAILFAAARGSRMPHLGPSKMLALVDGVPLMERIMGIAVDGGVDDIIAVTGYESGQVQRIAENAAARLGVSVRCVPTPHWEKGNGYALLAAAPLLNGPFHLLMPDHLLDPAIMHDIRRNPLPLDGMRMAVDGNLRNPLVDYATVTKILHISGQIKNIGKDLQDYNAVAAGVFYCSTALVAKVDANITARNDDSLSSGILALARENKAETMLTGVRSWINVDDPAAHPAQESPRFGSATGG